MNEPDNSVVLALDLGTNCGWALYNRGAITSGDIDFSLVKNKKVTELPGHRYLKFKEFLHGILSQYPALSCIAYEKVRRHNGHLAAHVYGGFQSHLQAFCVIRKIELVHYEVRHIKSKFCGSGNAGKKLMVSTAQSLGYDVKSDDEADAIAVLHTHFSANPINS
jgi:Holliday junction resolvasome RuvABC endonuclease subunit